MSEERPRISRVRERRVKVTGQRETQSGGGTAWRFLRAFDADSGEELRVLIAYAAKLIYAQPGMKRRLLCYVYENGKPVHSQGERAVECTRATIVEVS